MQPFRTLAIVIGASLLVGVAAPATAQTKPTRSDVGPDPIRCILWVGNSFFYYNNSMHGHYNDLVRAAEPGGKNRGTSVTISGSGLDWHDIAALPAARRHRQVLVRARQQDRLQPARDGSSTPSS